MVFTDQAGVACTKSEPKRGGVRRVASMVNCILLRTAGDADLHMDASFNELINFRRGHFQRQLWEYDVTASWVPYLNPTRYLTR